jgi:hypothetical protein
MKDVDELVEVMLAIFIVLLRASPRVVSFCHEVYKPVHL